jgi:hypothetical protein
LDSIAAFPGAENDEGLSEEEAEELGKDETVIGEPVEGSGALGEVAMRNLMACKVSLENPERSTVTWREGRDENP